MTILCFELLCHVSNELVIQIVLNEVDGTATKAATHDARTSHAIFLSNVVEEVKLFAAYLILFAKSVMRFVHHLSNGLVVASIECITDSENTFLLTENEVRTLIVLSTYLVLNSL